MLKAPHKLAIADLSAGDRIEKAKEKTSRLVDQVLHLLELHETNRIVVYSPALSSQIPRSHAAHAFNTFQDALHRFEIVRLCALWDAPKRWDADMASIPTVVELINDSCVLDALQEEIRLAVAQMGTRFYPQSEDQQTQQLIEEAIRHSQEAFASRRSAADRRRLQTAIRWSKRLQTSSRMKAVQNLRDKYLAHSLERTRLEKTEAVAIVKYGDERRLLWQAVAVVDALHRGINGAGFDWKSSMEMARRNADALWNGCVFIRLRPFSSNYVGVGRSCPGRKCLRGMPSRMDVSLLRPPPDPVAIFS